MSSTDPILWVKANHKGRAVPAYVWKNGRRVRATDDMGRPLLERIPAIGFVGKDLANMKPMAGKRSIKMLTKQGNEISVPLSTGASLAAVEGPFKSDRLRKLVFYGAITVGSCPVREVYRGLRKEHLLSPDARDATAPCAEHDVGVDEAGNELPPCPHYVAERDARMAMQVADNRKVNLTFKDDAGKQTEALTEIAAGNRAIVEHLVAQSAAAKAEQPAPKGKDGK